MHAHEKGVHTTHVWAWLVTFQGQDSSVVNEGPNGTVRRLGEVERGFMLQQMRIVHSWSAHLFKIQGSIIYIVPFPFSSSAAALFLLLACRIVIAFPHDVPPRGSFFSLCLWDLILSLFFCWIGHFVARLLASIDWLL
mmetsp:Transcript_4834/g.2941  ORF Transcript_4834/g.2941 Transcript_4834/m.2941 type:complete len:138 (-) Transcript_4834:77-490(-)